MLTSPLLLLLWDGKTDKTSDSFFTFLDFFFFYGKYLQKITYSDITFFDETYLDITFLMEFFFVWNIFRYYY